MQAAATSTRPHGCLSWRRPSASSAACPQTRPLTCTRRSSRTPRSWWSALIKSGCSTGWPLGCCCLLLPVTACYCLAPPCYCLLLPATACYCLPLPATACPLAGWLLHATAMPSTACLLLPATTSCCCCRLLLVAVFCHSFAGAPLSAACRCLPLPALLPPPSAGYS